MTYESLGAVGTQLNIHVQSQQLSPRMQRQDTLLRNGTNSDTIAYSIKDARNDPSLTP